jgi:hypothetical protein
MPATPSVEDIVRQVAGRYQFRDPDLLVATVNQESGGNARAVGDNGHSRGIFQENDRGRGAGLSPEQSFDPYASTERAIQEFNATYRPGLTRGQWAAAAQRPADRSGYARSIDAALGGGPSGAPGATRGGVDTSGAPAWVTDLLSTSPGGVQALPNEPRGATGRVEPLPNPPPGAPTWVLDLLKQPGYRSGAPAGSGGTDYAGAPQTDEVWPVAGHKWGQVNNPFGGVQARSAGATVALPSSNVGADLTAGYGDAVVAPVSGTIEQVYDAQAEHNPNENSGWGGMTVLRGDNGYTYRLSHAAPGSIATRPGQRVAQGQQLQRVGISGNSTGPHVDAEKFDRPGHFVDIAAGRGATAAPPTGSAGAPAPDSGPVPAWVRDLLGKAT